MQAMNRRMGLLGSGLALALGGFFVAGEAEAGDRWDYWDPRASIPARIVDTQLGVIGLAAILTGDYRTAAVVDHLSGRFPATAPVPVAVVEHVYYPPPPVVEHVYYYAPPPVIVHHVHAMSCGHGGYGFGPGYAHHRGHGRGYARHDRWDD